MASAFTHFYSLRLGERSGKLASFTMRNILGIPVWVYGLILASRGSASPLFIPNLTTEVLGWVLLLTGTIPMVWGLLLLGLRSFRPTEQDTLVSNGLYNYIRHSIYSGLLIDFIVLPLLRPAIPAVLACALGWSFVFIQARLESWIWSSAYLRTASIWSKCLAFSPAFGKGD